jgi:drug/metabolite transporter (DMT)-like permease
MKNIGVLWALVASVVWGLVYNIDEKLVLKTNPLTIFLLGNILQLGMLLPYFFTSTWKNDIKTMDSGQFWLLFIGEILYLISGLAILYAVKYLSAPVASAIEISYPFFVAIFAYFIFKGEINTNVWIGGALIFIGSVIVIR